MARVEHQSGAAEPTQSQTPEERAFHASAEAVWVGLVDGFRHDVEESRQIPGAAMFERPSPFQLRVASNLARTEVLVTADLSTHTIKYVYQPEDPETAVPEGGMLTLRAAGSSIALYSADQRLTPEQVRRLILEPLRPHPPVKNHPA